MSGTGCEIKKKTDFIGLFLSKVRAMKEENKKKWRELKDAIAYYGPSVVAFSGGVDSTLLLLAAIEALGRENVVAVTADSATLTEDERCRALKIAKEMNVRHMLLAGPEFAEPLFVENGPDRCYHCKKSRFLALLAWGEAQGFPTVIEGTHAGDLGDYRPGLKAIEELGSKIKSPLKDLGWQKDEIREISKELELKTWDLPSAACLASRIAYGIPLIEEHLKQVDEAEIFLRNYIIGPLRVRHHGNWVRIEVNPEDWGILMNPSVASAVTEKIKGLGFDYVTLDLSGLKSGSMNVGLK